MRYYLIAGEASGDMHAANLIKAIRREDPGAEFRCFGGDRMKEAGASLAIHYRDMALMGGIEVLKKYPVIRKNRDQCRHDILDFNPDALILVDYSGFNLPMARYAAKHNLRVIYYISPKLWAWAKWRVKSVRLYTEKMFVILPFEVEFYRNHQVQAEYYGNPVLDSIVYFEDRYDAGQDFRKKNKLNEKPIVALLSGSRKQEIELLLPEMLAVVKHYPGHQFVVAGAPSITPDYYSKYIDGTGVGIVYDQTYQLLKNARAAIVTSGTATLETALLNIPEVVVYKTSPVTFFVGNFFVKIKFFSLVNLILDKEAVKELLQDDLAGDIKSELDKLLFDEEYRAVMLQNYKLLREKLGEPGVADRVAGRIHAIVNTEK
ncbi:MAG TPA: lipid-A-disaccharide synthase [Bacteroidales bacterium]|nr:lipid-A-disaccharide synthase [Bacteroidales bacterium]